MTPLRTQDQFGLILRQVFGSRIFYPFLFAVVLILALLPYYANGTIILGGEGNVILDFSTHLKMHAYQWFSRYSFGMPSLAPGANGINAIFHLLTEKLSGSQAVTNFLVVFPIYYLPFLGMYLLATQIQAKPHLAFLVAFFYVINPFYSQWVISLNEWNVYAGAVLPVLLWIILRCYRDNLKLFLFYGFTTASFSFAYTNHPLNAIINIATLLSIYIASCYHNKRFLPFEATKKYLLVFSAYLLFNGWWLINLFYSMSYAQKLYDATFVSDWLFNTVNTVAAPLSKAFSLRMIVTPSQTEFFGYFYHTPISIVVTLVPIMLVLGLFPFIKKTSLYKLSLNIFIFAIVTLFLIKGAAQPFGAVYLFLFKNLPFFNIFKSPVEKFGLLYTFLFAVLLLFILHSCRDQKIYRKAMTLFLGYLLFCFIPVLTGNIIPESNLAPFGSMSRRFVDKPEYRAAREDINKDSLDYRVLSLPGMGNYQILMDNYDGKKYTGTDPIMNNINKAYISVLSESEKVVSRNLAESPEDLLLSLFNIGKLVVNDNLVPWFGTVGLDADSLRRKFRDLPKNEFGKIAIFDNTDKFVPNIYAPSSFWVVEGRRS